MELIDKAQRILIIGKSGGTHLGGSLARAAGHLGHMVRICKVEDAYRAPRIVAGFYWRYLDRRPVRLREFCRSVLHAVDNFRPSVLVCVGLAPVTKSTLSEIANHGVKRVSYLTDDPWNPSHKCRWFENALPEYDLVLTPRLANISELSAIGCPRVKYLPFAYDPSLFFPEQSSPKMLRADHAFNSDVLFIGGADSDRVPYIAALIRAGLNVAAYGGYWERYAATRVASRGLADPSMLRLATLRTKVALCLVRKANRDGHVMRTFEIAAMGACMLAEWTPEHEEILGAEGDAVLYFRSQTEMVEKARWLLDNHSERARLAYAVQRRIVNGKNTYKDRLTSILDFCNASISPITDGFISMKQ